MSRNEIRETLEKQLQLLSERSAGVKSQNYMDLVELTKSMCLLANTIICLPGTPFSPEHKKGGGRDVRS